MKYLEDHREPITLDDIDRALDDSARLLELEGHAAFPPAAVDIIERLRAIVFNTYGVTP